MDDQLQQQQQQQLQQNQIIGAIKIKDGLFIGDEYACQDLEFIVSNKVTHVINCAGLNIGNIWEQIGVMYLTFPWSETDLQVLFDEQDEILTEIVKFIDEAYELGESTLVHSVKGQNRSCCVLAAYFMKKYNWALLKTLEFLNSRKPDLEIRASFFEQLTGLERKLQLLGIGAMVNNWSEMGVMVASQGKPISTHITTAAIDETIIRNTYLNSRNAPIAEIFLSPAIQLQLLRAEKNDKLTWNDVHHSKDLQTAFYPHLDAFNPLQHYKRSSMLNINKTLRSCFKGTKARHSRINSDVTQAKTLTNPSQQIVRSMSGKQIGAQLKTNKSVKNLEENEQSSQFQVSNLQNQLQLQQITQAIQSQTNSSLVQQQQAQPQSLAAAYAAQKSSNMLIQQSNQQAPAPQASLNEHQPQLAQQIRSIAQQYPKHHVTNYSPTPTGLHGGKNTSTNNKPSHNNELANSLKNSKLTFGAQIASKTPPSTSTLTSPNNTSFGSNHAQPPRSSNTKSMKMPPSGPTTQFDKKAGITKTPSTQIQSSIANLVRSSSLRGLEEKQDSNNNPSASSQTTTSTLRHAPGSIATVSNSNKNSLQNFLNPSSATNANNNANQTSKAASTLSSNSFSNTSKNNNSSLLSNTSNSSSQPHQFRSNSLPKKLEEESRPSSAQPATTLIPTTTQISTSNSQIQTTNQPISLASTYSQLARPSSVPNNKQEEHQIKTMTSQLLANESRTTPVESAQVTMRNSLQPSPAPTRPNIQNHAQNPSPSQIQRNPPSYPIAPPTTFGSAITSTQNATQYSTHSMLLNSSKSPSGSARTSNQNTLTGSLKTNERPPLKARESNGGFNTLPNNSVNQTLNTSNQNNFLSAGPSTANTFGSPNNFSNSFGGASILNSHNNSNSNSISNLQAPNTQSSNSAANTSQSGVSQLRQIFSSSPATRYNAGQNTQPSSASTAIGISMTSQSSSFSQDASFATANGLLQQNKQSLNNNNQPTVKSFNSEKPPSAKPSQSAFDKSSKENYSSSTSYTVYQPMQNNFLDSSQTLAGNSQSNNISNKQNTTPKPIPVTKVTPSYRSFSPDLQSLQQKLEKQKQQLSKNRIRSNSPAQGLQYTQGATISSNIQNSTAGLKQVPSASQFTSPSSSMLEDPSKRLRNRGWIS